MRPLMMPWVETCSMAGTIETTFPLGLDELGFKGSIFSDFGVLKDIDQVGAGIQDEDSLRASVGVGLSWRSPFGPIRVDLGFPVAKEDFDEEETFRFNFGTQF